MLHSTAYLAIALFVSYTSASFHDFGIPASNATVDVKAFNVVNFTAVNASEWIFAPILPGRQSFTLPVHSFLIEHEQLVPWSLPPVALLTYEESEQKKRLFMLVSNIRVPIFSPISYAIIHNMATQANT
jgi:hypothetical protein